MCSLPTAIYNVLSSIALATMRLSWGHLLTHIKGMCKRNKGFDTIARPAGSWSLNPYLFYPFRHPLLFLIFTWLLPDSFSCQHLGFSTCFHPTFYTRTLFSDSSSCGGACGFYGLINIKLISITTLPSYRAEARCSCLKLENKHHLSSLLARGWRNAVNL